MEARAPTAMMIAISLLFALWMAVVGRRTRKGGLLRYVRIWLLAMMEMRKMPMIRDAMGGIRLASSVVVMEKPGRLLCEMR